MADSFALIGSRLDSTYGILIRILCNFSGRNETEDIFQIVVSR